MRLLLLGAAMAALSAGSAAAQTTPGRIAVGANIGTTGVGAEVQVQATPHLTVRGGGDWFNYDSDYSTDTADYAAELDFSTLSAFVDLHPFASPFLISGGAYFGGRTIEVVGTPNQNVVVGGVTYTPAQYGRLVGESDFGDVAPFVGLGWNNAFHTASGWGFKVMAGATFGSDPTVELRREGGTALPPGGQAQFAAEVEAEERELEQELEEFKILPVLQLGLSYRF
jgi:hypothetical protein